MRVRKGGSPGQGPGLGTWSLVEEGGGVKHSTPDQGPPTVVAYEGAKV